MICFDFVVVVDRQNLVAFEVNFEGLDDFATNVRHNASSLVLFTLEIQRKGLMKKLPGAMTSFSPRFGKRTCKVCPGSIELGLCVRTTCCR